MSDEVSLMPGELVNWLKRQPALTNYTFLNEFPARKKETPLTRTIVAVGIESMKISDYFVENGEGVLERSEFCRLAEMKIRLSVHVPYKSGGTACHDAFTKVIDALSFNSDLNILNSGCGDISADRDTDAFVLSCWVNIEAQFCPADSTGENYESFMPKTLFCSSHINNAVIHVTQADKDLWNEPYFTFDYFGTDETRRNFDLGFKPKFLVINAQGWPPVFKEIDGSLTIYSGSGSENYTSLGLEITSTGFATTQPAVSPFPGHNARLNKSAVRYSGIAFK